MGESGSGLARIPMAAELAKRLVEAAHDKQFTKTIAATAAWTCRASTSPAMRQDQIRPCADRFVSGSGV